MTEQPDPHHIPAPEETRQAVANLVERYRRNADHYTSGAYNEAQARVEFINPFFDALGWDIANKQGYAQPYKEVIHEDALKVSGATKAPDYCFRIGGQRKFFLEAKKPSVHIKTDPSPAYQLRRYGWSAKLPLSILTDFEEFAVYDCTKRPKESDGPAVARVDFITYEQYLDRLDDIYSIFAKEAILKGSFDRYAEGTRRKRGTAEVDSEFLKEIEAWRELLAKDIARHNPNLSVYDLNFAVQATIDRILFFRIAEDRGVEPYGRLRGLLDGNNLYPRLCELYHAADAKYNAGLFDFSKYGDTLSHSLQIADKALEAILSQLYYPQCPYEFSVIGADILGAVYEQFLGKVIRLTPSRRVKVEEKPEVKKAGGVYYTPTYIVDYIVEHTVGEALKEAKTPKQAEKLRILDPACGSGSFLLGAYQYLLNWHLDYYVNDNPQKYARRKQPPVVRVAQNEWRLTTLERKRILLSNIYGVDIDSQAVEVTKLNLLLKCLEGETEQTLAQQLQIFQERALPNLADNIKCGNSLIGPDYYTERDPRLFDEDESRRVNAFDWEAEFPDIMAAGGFDCVIGNPPWGGDIDVDLPYFHKNYPHATQENTDSFKLFIARGATLTSTAGRLGMIVPSAFIRQSRYKDVREVLLEGTVVRVVDFGEDVFFDVVAPSSVFVAMPRKPAPSEHEIDCIDVRQFGSPLDRREALVSGQAAAVPLRQSDALSQTDLALWPPITIHIGERANVQPLGEVKEIVLKDAGINYQRVGVGMSVKGRSNLGQRLLYEGKRERASHAMLWKGADIDRYWMAESTNKFCRPECAKTLKSNEVVRLSYQVYDTAPKILLRQTADRVRATIDTLGVWFGRSVLTILPAERRIHSLSYFLGLLNSRHVAYVYDQLVKESGRVFAQVKLSKLKQLPIRTIDFSDPADVARHDKMVGLVERMLDLHQCLAEAKTPTTRDRIQRQITATDQAIDALVYELYDLTDEEIAIVEE